MFSIKSFCILGALISVVGLTGCRSVNTIERSQSRANPNYVDDQRVITDNSANRNLTIVSVIEGQVSGDLLKIQATVQNNSRNDRDFNYMFEWILDDGMVHQGAVGGWRKLNLQGGETRSISGVATSPRAVDFRLKVQEGQALYFPKFDL